MAAATQKERTSDLRQLRPSRQTTSLGFFTGSSTDSRRRPKSSTFLGGGRTQPSIYASVGLDKRFFAGLISSPPRRIMLAISLRAQRARRLRPGNHPNLTAASLRYGFCLTGKGARASTGGGDTVQGVDSGLRLQVKRSRVCTSSSRGRGCSPLRDRGRR